MPVGGLGCMRLRIMLPIVPEAFLLILIFPPGVPVFPGGEPRLIAGAMIVAAHEGLILLRLLRLLRLFGCVVVFHHTAI